MKTENLLQPALLAEAEMLHCLGSVESRNIKCAVIKGIPLARALYGTVDARGVPVDCDLLVRHQDAALAVEALIDAGYSSPYLPVSQSSYTNVWKVVLRKNFDDGVSSTVELHLAPFSPWAHPLSERLIWNHMMEFKSHSRNILVPDRELTLVMLACHFAQSGFSNYKILRDLAVAWDLWQNNIDFNNLCALISGSKSNAHLNYALRVISNLRQNPSAQINIADEARELLLLDNYSTGVKPPRVGSDQAAKLLEKLFPYGRIPQADIDHRGQIYAFLLSNPSQILLQGFHQLFPSQLGLSIALDESIDSRLKFFEASIGRILSLAGYLLGTPLFAMIPSFLPRDGVSNFPRAVHLAMKRSRL